MARREQSPLRPPGASAVIDHSAGAAFIREQPVHEVPASGYQHHKAAKTGRYEVICVACGDNPDLDYSEAVPEIKHVRGPYRTADAARNALRQHLKLLSGR